MEVGFTSGPSHKMSSWFLGWFVNVLVRITLVGPLERPENQLAFVQGPPPAEQGLAYMECSELKRISNSSCGFWFQLPYPYMGTSASSSKACCDTFGLPYAGGVTLSEKLPPNRLRVALKPSEQVATQQGRLATSGDRSAISSRGLEGYFT